MMARVLAGLLNILVILEAVVDIVTEAHRVTQEQETRVIVEREIQATKGRELQE